MVLGVIIDVLADGKYHTFTDIITELRQNGINENQAEAALDFLAQAGFVKLLRRRWIRRPWKAQLTTQMLIFLKRLDELEGKS